MLELHCSSGFTLSLSVMLVSACSKGVKAVNKYHFGVTLNDRCHGLVERFWLCCISASVSKRLFNAELYLP